MQLSLNEVGSVTYTLSDDHCTLIHSLLLLVDCSSSRIVNIIIIVFVVCITIVIMVIMLSSFVSAAKDSVKRRRSSQKSQKLVRKDSIISKPISLNHNPYSFHGEIPVCVVCWKKHPTNGPSSQETRYSAAYRRT